MLKKIKKYKSEIFFSILFLFIGMLVGKISNSGNNQWYENLERASFTPPNILFPIIWSILYLSLGVIFTKILRINKNKKIIIGLFILQFILNIAWPIIFFHFNIITLALYDLILFWIITAALIYMVRKERIIFMLFIPYFIWISLAVVLNYYIYILN